ncbi:MAG: 50S ribosomal protein L29 [Acidobacteria bacterium]|nr:50S ribosomal protein L29 [Acidobacteriota bacterium]
MKAVVKLRDMSTAELEEEARKLSEQLFRLRFQKSTGQLEGPHKIRGVRKELARVKTILTQKARAAAAE